MSNRTNRLPVERIVGNLELRMSDVAMAVRSNSYKFTTEELVSMQEVIDFELNFRENGGNKDD